MASEAESDAGPVMLCATRVLKAPPARIGHIVGNVTLPRTVEIRVLIASVLGAIGLFAIATPIVGLSLRSAMMSMIFGGFAGAASMKISPLQGETLFRWIGLEARSRVGRLRYNGEWVRVYVGVCPLRRAAAGRTKLTPQAVDVPPGAVVDERGWRDPDAVKVVAKTVHRRPAGTAMLHAAPTDLSPVAAQPSWASRRRTPGATSPAPQAAATSSSWDAAAAVQAADTWGSAPVQSAQSSDSWGTPAQSAPAQPAPPQAPTVAWDAVDSWGPTPAQPPADNQPSWARRRRSKTDNTSKDNR